jgi:hypothetical protein
VTHLLRGDKEPIGDKPLTLASSIQSTGVENFNRITNGPKMTKKWILIVLSLASIFRFSGKVEDFQNLNIYTDSRLSIHLGKHLLVSL